MAISLQKPNMLGANRSFGSQRTTSASTTAAQNLSSGVRPNAFSFRNISKKSWVSGQNTIKGYNQYNYQRTRAALNPRTYTAPTVDRSSVPSYTNVSYQPSSSYANGMKWGMGIAIGLGVLNTVGGMLGGNNKVSASQQLGAAINSLGGNTPTATSFATNSDIALSISNMASCNDSKTLNDAIGTAEGELRTMEGMTPGLEAQETTAKENLNALNGLASAAEKEKGTAQTGVTQCKGAVNAIAAKRNAALGAVKTGNQEYDNAVADYNKKHDASIDAQNNKTRAQAGADRADQALKQAQNGVTEAKNALASIPNDPEHAAERAAAQARLDQARAAESNAKDAKAQADKALEDAKKKEEDAIAAEKQAKEAKQAAYDKLGDLQTKAKEMEQALDQEQQKLDDAKRNLLKAEQNFDEVKQKFDDVQTKIDSENSVVNLLKTHKNDVQALREAINSEKSRLSKIQKAEEKEDKNKTKLDAQDDK